MSEKPKKTIWDAVGELSLKDQIMLIVGVVGIVIVVVGGLLFLMLKKTSLIDFELPDSGFRSSADGQSYRHETFTDLDIMIQFPNTDYVAYVGKATSLYNNYAASFSYTDEIQIVVGAFEKTESVDDFYDVAVSAVLEKGFEPTDETYTSLRTDRGYLNTQYLIYDAGRVHMKKDYYLLSYLYDTGTHYLMMATVFSKPDKIQAYTSKNLLDKVFYTLAKLPPEDASASVDKGREGIENEVSGEAAGQDEQKASDGDEAEDDSTASVARDLRRTLKTDMYKINYPDATELESPVSVSDEFSDKDSIIFIWFSELEAIPDEAYLLSPNGLKYSPSYTNEDMTGMVYWEVESPVAGDWLVHLSANMLYGSYSCGVMERAEFNEVFIEHTDPTPRDSE